MKVVILGAGTAIPATRRSPSGLYVRAGEERLLFDAGPGTLQRLHAVGVTFLQLDRLFLTHLHPDHCLDLVSILFAMHVPQPARTKPFVVYGPPGTARLYRRLNAAFQGWLRPRSYRLTFRELTATRLRLPGSTVSTKLMRHTPGALGYRLQIGGRSMVYSGDTDTCEEVVELGRKADLLILECSMTDERKVAGHLTPTECGRIAARANCRHLALTHFYPVVEGYDIRARVRRSFSGRLTVARDLATFVL